MDIYLDAATSLMLMRATATNNSITLAPTNESKPARPSVRPATLHRLGIPELLGYLHVPEERPLGIVVPKPEDRTRSANITCSVDAMTREGSSFLELRSACEDEPSLVVPKRVRVLAQSPANIVLGMAKLLRRKVLMGKLSSVRATLLLVKLCLELCGTYAHDPFQPQTGNVAYHVPQRIKREDLLSFLKADGTEQGLSLARRAVTLAYDLSGSPQESCMGPALFYASRFGGLGLCDYVANESLELTPREHESIDFRTITPDFQLPKYHSVVEFLGLVHEKGENPRIDHQRSLDYQTLGIREFSFWYEDVRTVSAFMRSARRIVSVIEQYEGPDVVQRFNRLAKDSAFCARQNVLFEVFRPWLRGTGLVGKPIA